jgi:hypothetical protein
MTPEKRAHMIMMAAYCGTIGTALLALSLALHLPDFVRGVGPGLLVGSIFILLWRSLRDEYFEGLWAAGASWSFIAMIAWSTLVPMYLLERMIGRMDPPAITHPEFFYGFIGVALAWQFVFVLIARDPIRLRALMTVAVLEKLGYGGAVVALYLGSRVGASTLVFGIIDLVLAALFVAAWRRTPATH